MSQINNLYLRQLVLIQLGIGLVISALTAALSSPSLGVSVMVGASLIASSVALLGWTMNRVLAKKSIAWTVSIIVIKYAVLLGSIPLLMRTNWFSPIGAGIGVASFVLAALGVALIDDKKELG